jgi:hypothetical protein
MHKGVFVCLCADIGHLSLRTNLAPKGMPRCLGFTLDTLWDILTTCDRLEWAKEKCKGDPRLNSTWSYYASADIEYWHIKMRSLLDHIAKLISNLAERKNQVPDSFAALYKRATGTEAVPEKTQNFAHKLGPDWLELLRSATWFPALLDIRDEVVHWGGHTMVFLPPEEGIRFQVYRGFSHKNIIDLKPLMFNQNVVCFDRYAAHLLSHLLLFLEDFAIKAYARLGVEPMLNGMSRHFGLGTVIGWIDSTVIAVSRATVVPGESKSRIATGRPTSKVESLEPPGGHASLIVGPDD